MTHWPKLTEQEKSDMDALAQRGELEPTCPNGHYWFGPTVQIDFGGGPPRVCTICGAVKPWADVSLIPTRSTSGQG